MLQLFTDFSSRAGDCVCMYVFICAYSQFAHETMYVNATNAKNYAPLSRLIRKTLVYIISIKYEIILPFCSGHR